MPLRNGGCSKADAAGEPPVVRRMAPAARPTPAPALTRLPPCQDPLALTRLPPCQDRSGWGPGIRNPPGPQPPVRTAPGTTTRTPPAADPHQPAAQPDGTGREAERGVDGGGPGDGAAGPIQPCGDRSAAPAGTGRTRRRAGTPRTAMSRSWSAESTNCSRRPSRPPPGPVRSDVVLVDATLGMGGHTLALLSAHPELRVIGIDRDPQALGIAESRLAAAGLTDRVELVHAVYDRIGEVIDATGRCRPGAGDPVRPRRLFRPAGRVRPRLRLRPGRPVGHADGSDDRHHGGRRDQHLPGRGTDQDPAGVRRRAVRRPDLQGAGRRAQPAAVHHQRPAGRTRPGGHSGRHSADRRQPRQAHLPGAADRGQRRAGCAAAGHSRCAAAPFQWPAGSW